MEQTSTRSDATQGDRVRAHTGVELISDVDRATKACLQTFANAGPKEITRHIEELDREWDVERRLQANASILALSGVLLGATKDKKWLMLSGVVFSFFLQHALQGWCPPLPIFRRMGVRTRKEINREKYALKALRGDFAKIDTPKSQAQAGENA
jgi:hypothetical protein